MNAYIDIVFDGPPSHESGRFVEVENQDGLSINFGEWVQRHDGLWALRIVDSGSQLAASENERAAGEWKISAIKDLLANASGETNLIDVGPLRLAACVNKIAALLHDDTPPLAVMDGMWDPYDERFYPASEAPPANEMSLDYGQVTVIVVGRKP